MPVTIGSALSFHWKDNARISANGRFYYFVSECCGDMMRM